MQTKLYWKPSVYHTMDRCGQILRCPWIKKERAYQPWAAELVSPDTGVKNRNEE